MFVVLTQKTQLKKWLVIVMIQLYICGQMINALIVTVSKVTYMPKNVNESLEDKPVIRDLQDFQLKFMVLEVMHFNL